MEKIVIVSPNELKDVDLCLEDFEAFIRKGGEAQPQFLDTAKCLICFFSKALAGVAALKTDRNYRHTNFANAGVLKLADQFDFELGYVVVDERLKGRGISHLLVSSALSRRDKKGVYATSNLTNLRMHKVLESRGFIRAGVPWESKLNKGTFLALFLLPGARHE